MPRRSGEQGGEGERLWRRSGDGAPAPANAYARVAKDWSGCRPKPARPRAPGRSAAWRRWCGPPAGRRRDTSSAAAISSRIFSSERRISRETCICEMPICCAICDCVRPSKKRRCRIFRSRSSSTRKPGASTARSSDTSYWCSSRADRLERIELLAVLLRAAGRERERRVRAAGLERLEHLFLLDRAAFASSGIVGERPSCTVSCSISRESCTFSSCSPRGTRTDQPLSRKCRLISPMMFGVAYVVSSTPRSRSKRSIALISPIAPIWTRSSSCSPRYE